MEKHKNKYLYQRVVTAKLYIDGHYADQLKLDGISDQAYFSKYHFIRLFKSIYGNTPKSYLIKIRMDRAKNLLAAGHSVSATSIMVGFDSPTSFAGMFKRQVGETPSGFQRKQLAAQAAMNQNPFAFVPNCFAETHGWKNRNFQEAG